MTTVYVDFNDLIRPGCVVVRAKMQPDGKMPSLKAGSHVLLREYGDDEVFEAVIKTDESHGVVMADLDAARQVSSGLRGGAAAGR